MSMLAWFLGPAELAGLLVMLGLVVGLVVVVTRRKRAPQRGFPVIVDGCPRCGERHEPDARLCRRCGQTLIEAL